jgi:hypothetical protein
VIPYFLPAVIAALSLVVFAEERILEVEAFLEFALPDWYFSKASLAQISADAQHALVELLLDQ